IVASASGFNDLHASARNGADVSRARHNISREILLFRNVESAQHRRERGTQGICFSRLADHAGGIHLPLSIARVESLHANAAVERKLALGVEDLCPSSDHHLVW